MIENKFHTTCNNIQTYKTDHVYFDLGILIFSNYKTTACNIAHVSDAEKKTVRFSNLKSPRYPTFALQNYKFATQQP